MLNSRTISLEDEPEAEGFDPAELQRQLESLSDKVSRIDIRTTGTVKHGDLADLAEAISSDLDGVED